MSGRAERVARRLAEMYPYDGKCFLSFGSPWQLMAATILSAQCTDARVNAVTAELFAKYPTADALLAAELADVERIVRPAGFYHAKARNLIASARRLAEDFGGEMPSDVETLTTFPGVGRKTANVVRSHVFALPSIVVDTHVKRVSYRLGLTDSDDPARIERDLSLILPEELWCSFNPLVITHGRAVCRAIRADCAGCGLSDLCGKRVAVPRHTSLIRR